VHAHNERERVAEVLERLGRGEKVALVSDAGTTGFVRPRRAPDLRGDRRGHKVTTVPGPSAAVSALVVAGLGPHAGDSKASCREKGRARQASRRDRGGVAPERDLRVAAAGHLDVARPRATLRRRSEGGGLSGADQAVRGDLAGHTRRGMRAPRGQCATREHVLVVAAATVGQSPAPSEDEVQSEVARRMAPAPAAGRPLPRWPQSSVCRRGLRTSLRSLATAVVLRACTTASF